MNKHIVRVCVGMNTLRQYISRRKGRLKLVAYEILFSLFFSPPMVSFLQVVDLALVVKQDMRAVVSDPLSRFLAPVQHNYHDLQSSMLFPSATRPALGGLASPARVGCTEHCVMSNVPYYRYKQTMIYRILWLCYARLVKR